MSDIIKEKIKKESEGYGTLAPAFIEGANFALEKLWINFKEKEPPIGVEVIAYHHKWVDEDFNPNGTRIGFLSDDGFVSAVWLDEHDCYETISEMHCEDEEDFFEDYIDNTEPEFWFPMPKCPKTTKRIRR